MGERGGRVGVGGVGWGDGLYVCFCIITTKLLKKKEENLPRIFKIQIRVTSSYQEDLDPLTPVKLPKPKQTQCLILTLSEIKTSFSIISSILPLHSDSSQSLVNPSSRIQAFSTLFIFSATSCGFKEEEEECGLPIIIG